MLSCEPLEYERASNEYLAGDILRIEISANAEHLLANENAEIDFDIVAYYAIERTQWVEEYYDAEIIRDSVFMDTVAYAKQNLPDGVNIYNTEGEIVSNFKYRAGNTDATQMKFFANINDVYSDTIEVKINKLDNADWGEYEIPLIFHVVENKENAEVYKNMDFSAEISKVVENMNLVFSGQKIPNAPHSMDSKIRFVLATEDPDGKMLETPGIHYVNLGEVEDDEVLTKIDENYLWDSNKYLNVWLAFYPYWGWYGPLAEAPMHITTDNDQVLPGLNDNMSLVTEGDDVPYSTATDIGIVLTPTDLNAPNLLYSIGIHYGLIPTRCKDGGWGGTPIVDGDVDYCFDTYSWWYRYTTPIKRRWPDYSKYLSLNIMDENSKGSILSYCQAQRIHDAIKYCPLRQHIK